LSDHIKIKNTNKHLYNCSIYRLEISLSKAQSQRKTTPAKCQLKQQSASLTNRQMSVVTQNLPFLHSGGWDRRWRECRL